MTSRKFSLSQQTAFLDFTIFTDGMTNEDFLRDVVIQHKPASYWVTIGSMNKLPVVVVGDHKTASFIVPVAAGTALTSLTIEHKLSAGYETTNSYVLLAGPTEVKGKVYRITRQYDNTGSIGKRVNLSNLTGNYRVSDHEVLTGTLSGNYKVTIADGARITLDDATITGTDNSKYNWAGLTCEGDATIFLRGTNTVKGFYQDYPGIYVPKGKTLTIESNGSLTASSGGSAYGAGIGAGSHVSLSCGNIVIKGGNITASSQHGAGIGGAMVADCGNIEIQGGTVNATGGDYSAGIGCGNGAKCGNITISGGTINATGGYKAAAIGGANSDGSSCGIIRITTGVTSLTATKSAEYPGPNCVGAGKDGSCSMVVIGGVTYWNVSSYENGGETYLTTSPLVYPKP